MEIDYMDTSFYDMNYGSNVKSLTFAKSFFPNPSKTDYETGFITRYFLKNVSSSKIYEVSRDNYTSVIDSLYIKNEIEWKITGNRNTTTTSGNVINVGVYDFNKKNIDDLNYKMNGIKSILYNPLQFWKGS